MVRIIILELLFVNSVLSRCPYFNSTKAINFDFDFYRNLHFEGYRLYQYKSVDQKIQSPFFVFEGKSRKMYLSNSMIKSVCSYFGKDDSGGTGEAVDVFSIHYNYVSLINFNNATKMFKLNYTGTNLFCDENLKMDDIFVIDYEKNNFASFYGCKDVVIDKQVRTVEGVLIFLVALFGKPRNTVGLNYTYNMLQTKFNIPQASLKTSPMETHQHGPPDSCNDLKNGIIQREDCKKVLEELKKIQMEEAVEASKNFPYTVLWTIVLIATVLQILYQVLKSTKRVRLNLRFLK